MHSSSLKKETARTFETSVNFWRILRYRALHKLHIRRVIEVGNETLWLSGGLRIFIPGFANSDLLAQTLKYEHQRAYLVLALKTI